MKPVRRVLIVSFFYPPNPAVGGRRVSKFARYLPEFGWTPTVLTAATEASPSPGEEQDSTSVHATGYVSPWKLLKRSSGQSDLTAPTAASAAPAPGPPLRERMGRAGRLGRATYRALRHILPLSTVRLPDSTLGWVPFALAEGRRILRASAFDAIVSSAGPPSSHIVAAGLQRTSGLPWIADFRDLWSENYWDTRVAPFKWLEGRFEQHVLRQARLITTVAPAWARRLAAVHDKPTEVIYNGFDPPDYPDVPEPETHFVLNYMGTLIWPGQDPEPVFKALAHLAGTDGSQLDGVGFQLRFFGTLSAALQGLARNHGVERWVHQLPAVTYRESLARQMASTALLFVGWHDAAEDHITAKIFEYLGSGRPILAVGPSGSTLSQILRDCGAPDLTTDPEEIAARLGAWIQEFRATGAVASSLNEQPLTRYTRRAQTERLAQTLERALAEGP